MRSFLACVPLCLSVLTGCVSSDDEPGRTDTEDAEYRLERMPMPKVSWSRATNREHYFVFSTWDDAATWFGEFGGQHPYKGASVQHAAVPHEDPRYAAVEQATAAMWEAYRKLLPRETDGLEAPPKVLLVERDDVNAYPTLDWICPAPADDCLPHAIIVHTAALDGRGSVAGTRGRPLAGLLAHELAHHVLKHLMQPDGGMISGFYYASAAPSWGWQRREDPAAVAAAEGWLPLAALAGNFQLSELHGLPFPGSIRDMALEDVRREEAAKWPNECERARQSKNDLVALLKENVDTDAVTTAWTQESRKALDIAGARAADAYATCLKHTARRPAEVPGAEGAAIAATSYFEAVKELTLHDNARLRGMDVSKIRFYSNEEQADDIAHAALLRGGEDPRSLASFIRLNLMTPKARDACDATLASGAEPAYGSLHNRHHARCWRRWHSDRLIAFLKR